MRIVLGMKMTTKLFKGWNIGNIVSKKSLILRSQKHERERSCRDKRSYCKRERQKERVYPIIESDMQL